MIIIIFDIPIYILINQKENLDSFLFPPFLNNFLHLKESIKFEEVYPFLFSTIIYEYVVRAVTMRSKLVEKERFCFLPLPWSWLVDFSIHWSFLFGKILVFLPCIGGISWWFFLLNVFIYNCIPWKHSEAILFPLLIIKEKFSVIFCFI